MTINDTRKMPADFNRLPVEKILIGGLQVSREPIILDTILGSCIAACLYDPINAVGGMNHFMLPDSARPEEPTSARYGVYAMELLMNELVKAGAKRENFKAKVFGGGHVLKIRENLDGVPQRNIDFIHQFLETENIPLVNEDVGGYYPRRVLFYTSTGKALLKCLDTSAARETAIEEADYLDQLKSKRLDGDAELF